MEALYDASQEDVATGGPNVLRGIYPSVKTITPGGVQVVADDEVRAAFEAIVEDMHEGPGEAGRSQAREGSAPSGESSEAPA